jgi:hypothetical protein
MTARDTIRGKPDAVSPAPSEVIPGSQVVLLAVPAFAHEPILRDILPCLEEGTWVGALPARGGFEWCAQHLLAGRTEQIVLFGLQTLPWACRVRTFGQEVTILGTKAGVDLATQPGHLSAKVAALLGELMDVPVRPVAGFLDLSLANTGQLIHPGIMYGLFHAWNARPYTDAPLFYQGVDAAKGELLQQLSNEVQDVRLAFERRYPGLDLSSVRPLKEWLLRSYTETIEDTSSLQACFATNRSYAGLRAPMRSGRGGLVPDFQTRYLSEDIPYGLVVTRGLAELAEVPTPAIDRVIGWAQTRLGQEYLVRGKMQGRDLSHTRAPQRYGYTRLEDVVRQGLPQRVRREENYRGGI